MIKNKESRLHLIRITKITKLQAFWEKLIAIHSYPHTARISQNLIQVRNTPKSPKIVPT